MDPDGILTNIASEIIVRVSDRLLGEAARKFIGSPNELRLRATIAEALRNLVAGYSELEKIEGNASVPIAEYLNDDIVKAELFKIYWPDTLSREVLIQRYIDLYGRDDVDIFERNLSDFLLELYRINWEMMPPQQQFQTALLLDAVGKVEEKVERLLESQTSPSQEPTISLTIQTASLDRTAVVSQEDILSLQRQLTDAEENLRLIQERKAEYVLSPDVPLQYIKEERLLQRKVNELRQQLSVQQIELDQRKLGAQIAKNVGEQAYPDVPGAIRTPEFHAAVAETIIHKVNDYRDALNRSVRSEIQRARTLLKRDEITKGLNILAKVERTQQKVLGDLFIDIRFDLFHLLGSAHLVRAEENLAESYLARAAEVSPDDPRLLVSRAQLHLLQGRPNEAESLGKEAVRRNMHPAQAVEAVIQALLMQGKATEALEWLSSISINENLDQILICHARVRFVLNELDEAQHSAEKALKENPHNALANAILGDIKLAKIYSQIRENATFEQVTEFLDPNTLESIAAHYTQALRQLAHNSSQNLIEAVRVNLANVLNLLKRHPEALAQITQVLEHEPKTLDPWLVGARIARDNGEIELAESQCRRAAQLFPELPDPYFQLSEIELHRSKKEDALRSLDWAEPLCTTNERRLDLALFRSEIYASDKDAVAVRASLDSIPQEVRGYAVAMLAEANWSRMVGDIEGAQAILLNGLESYPKNTNLLATIGRLLLLDKHDAVGAVPYFERWVAQAPSRSSYFYFAQALYDAGDYKAAVDVIRRSRDLGLSDNRLRFFEGISLLNMHHFVDAVEAYQNIPPLEMDFDSWCNLGTAYRMIGRRRQSIDAYERALVLNEHEPHLLISLAELYLENNDPIRAYQYAARGLDADNDNPNAHLAYFRVAFFTGHEREATQILIQIPRRFPLFSGVQVMKTEDAAQHVIGGRERFQQMLDYYLAGNFPFVAAAVILNLPTSQLWHLFQRNKINFLYAHGTTQEQQAERTALSNSAIAIDYPALLTVSALNLFGELSGLFGKIYVSTHVMQLIVADRSSLIHTQRDRYQSRTHLKELLEQHPRIQKHGEWADTTGAMSPEQANALGPLTTQDAFWAKQLNALYVCDHPEDIEKCKPLLRQPIVGCADVLEMLDRENLLSAADSAKAWTYLAETNNPMRSSAGAVHRDEIVVLSWISLELLWDAGLLNVALTQFREIHISIASLVLVDEDLARGEVVESALLTLDKLEQALNTLPVFQIASPKNTEPFEPDSPQALSKQILEELAVASEIGVPLWTDDLAVRRLAASEYPAVITLCTRAVLDKALGSNVYSPQDYSERVFFLLSNRYEFTSINSLTLFWTLEHHKFQDNPDTQLVFSKLNETARQVIANLPKLNDVKEFIANLNDALYSYRSIISTTIALLWLGQVEIKAHVRNRWAKTILEQSLEIETIFPAEDMVITHLVTAFMEILSRGNREAARSFYSFAWYYSWSHDLEREFFKGLLVMARTLEHGNLPEEYRRSFVRELLHSVKGEQAPAALRRFIEQSHPDWLTTAPKDS